MSLMTGITMGIVALFLGIAGLSVAVFGGRIFNRNETTSEIGDDDGHDMTGAGAEKD